MAWRLAGARGPSGRERRMEEAVTGALDYMWFGVAMGSGTRSISPLALQCRHLPADDGSRPGWFGDRVGLGRTREKSRT